MKKKILCLSIAIVMGLSLAACSPKGAEKPADGSGTAEDSKSTSAEKVTIQFMHSMIEQERQEVIEGIIKDFEAINPTIDVEQVPVDEDSYQTKITAAGGSGTLPAILEVTQDFGKVIAKNEFLDYEANQAAVDNIGEDNFFSGALDVLKTEDGLNYTGVPIAGWVQGIWYNKVAFEEKGMKEPATWEDILAAAKAFNDPDNKKYGIALATANSTFTEQVFSQFALSNNANALDANGKGSFDTPEMKESLSFFKELSAYTMPGSNEVPQVRDAFMSGAAPMALYSTYILSSIYQEGKSEEIGFVLPTNKTQAAYGTITALSISADLPQEQKDAAIAFTTYMVGEANVDWIHLSPGGLQPVNKNVADSSEYLENEVVKAYEGISGDITDAFNNLKLFGTVEGKNFLAMGDITSKSIIGECIYNIVIQNQDIDEAVKKAQSEIEKITK